MKTIRIYLRVTDDISNSMKNGLNFEAAKKEAFRKYNKELEEVKRYECNSCKIK